MANTTGTIESNINQSLHHSTHQHADFNDIKESFTSASYVITPFFLAVGIFGNGLSILILTTKPFSKRKMMSRPVLICLALSDTVLLMTQPFNRLAVQRLLGFDLRALSLTGCKIFFVIFKGAKMTSSWLVVILCFERFVAIVFPLKVSRVVTMKTILGLITLDYFIIISYNISWNFSSQIVDGICKPDVVNSDTRTKFRIFLMIGLFMYSIIPMMIMSVVTPVIVYKLSGQSKLRRVMTSTSSRQRKLTPASTTSRYSTSLRSSPRLTPGAGTNNDETLRISIMLVGIVIALIVFILPITIVHGLAAFQNMSAFDTNNRSFFIFRETAQILEQLNYSTNFILYIFCSARFRARAWQILTCGWYRRRIALKRLLMYTGSGYMTSEISLETKIDTSIIADAGHM